MIAFNSLTVFRSRENTGNFSVFKGWPSFTIWPNTKRGEGGGNSPVVKVPLSLARLVRIKEFCEKILASEGEQRFQIDIWFWNKELGEEKYNTSIAIGRDAQGICYVEACSDAHKEYIRLPTTDDRSIRIDNQPQAPQSSTAYGLKLIIELVNCMIPTAMAISQAAGSVDDAPGGAAPASGPGDDIPF